MAVTTSKPIALVLMAPRRAGGRPLARELEPHCDVRYLSVVHAGGGDALHAYGAERGPRHRVHEETHEAFDGEDRGRPVRVLCASKWWWVARLAAGSLCQHGFRDVQVVAFSPIVSMRLSDHAGVEQHMARSHHAVASRWADHAGVRRLHAERLNLHPWAGLVVVYPRDNRSDAAVLEAEPHAEWLRHRPGTRVVALPTAVHGLAFLFVPSVEVRSEKLYLVGEETERCLSNDELALVRRLRADPALHIRAAAEDPQAWAERLADAVGTK